jgi:hypothetical protein
MIFLCRVSLGVLCVLACAQAIVPAPAERSVSTSRQFLVYGADVRLRGAICDLAEGTKREVLQLIDRRDEWATPIVVNAQYPRANLPETPPAALSFAQTGFGLKLQLDLTIPSNVSQPDVRRELLRAIVLEMMYRREPNLPAGAIYVPPPDWLLDGIPPSQSAFDRGSWVGVLRAPVTARRISSLEEFLRPRKLSGLDGPSRSLYRAYSLALVELLTKTPDGRARLAHFIADLPSASNDPMADLAAHFPKLSNASSAEKAWRLCIEQLATSQPFQLLSAEETEQKLDKLLAVKVFSAGRERNYRLEEFPQFVRDASSRLTLAGFSRDLSVLAARANPMYRPVIYQYEKITTLLARGKTSGIAEQLARLRALRKAVAARVRKIDDYMNWFEATKSQEPSGAFTDYLKAAEQASRPEPRRRDPISVYLDVLETQFQD